MIYARIALDGQQYTERPFDSHAHLQVHVDGLRHLAKRLISVQWRRETHWDREGRRYHPATLVLRYQ